MAIRAFIAFAFLAAAVISPALGAELITGSARVVDGDTVEIRERRLRLHGIDAFESAQWCRDEQRQPYQCGSEAAFALLDRIGGRRIRCLGSTYDRNGRLVAVCRRGRHDLNAYMVSSGWALAYRDYSEDYVDEESQAQQNKAGAWRGEFVPPWEWRRGVRLDPVEVSEDCTIKGNISGSDRIYHVPGSPLYERTQIDQHRGERWFCTIEEAEAAGWRAPL